MPLLHNHVWSSSNKSNIVVLDVPLGTLLLLTAQGDVPAFSRLYDATSARIHALVTRQVGECRADAVTQQVFLTLWRRAGDYAPSRGNALAWMVSLASHVAAERRAPAFFNPSLDPRQDRCSLTSRQQDILTLVYLGGFTHEQVAGIMALPRLVVAETVREGIGRLNRSLPAAS
jgi:RNA polymerase sigma-70 factor (ECF subfamily)